MAEFRLYTLPALLAAIGVYVVVFLLITCKPESREQSPARSQDTMNSLITHDTPRGSKNRYKQPLSSDSFKRKKTYTKEAAPGFYIVTASYSKREEAIACKNRLKERYERPVILPSESGYYRVAVRRFSQWRSATTFLQKRYESGDTNIWILRHKGYNN